MKKQVTLFLIAMAAAFTLGNNQSANAAQKNAFVTNNSFSAFTRATQFGIPKPWLQFVGAVYDPNDSTILYDMYGSGGSSGSLSTVIIFKNHVQQSGTGGVTISGSYFHSTGNLYVVTGTITRADSTSFSCSGTYDIA